MIPQQTSINIGHLPGITAFNAKGQAWTVRKAPEVSIHDKKLTKEESDKTRSYPSRRLNSKDDPRSLHSWWKTYKRRAQ